MSAIKRFFLLIGFPFVVVGCAIVSTAQPTLIPTEYVPTVIALTVNARVAQITATAEMEAMNRPDETREPALEKETPEITASATPSPLPSLTNTPSPTIADTPTSVSTATYTPSNTPSITPHPIIPNAAIEFNVPGQLSRVVSVIPIRALLTPGLNGRVIIELLGEDGRLLVRKIQIMNANLGRKVGLVTEINFEIPGVAELGRLQLRTEDEFGRTTALNSVDLILLNDGPTDYNVPGDVLARIAVHFPQPNTLISGGNLVLQGLARPFYSQPLVAELITRDGKIVGSRLVPVDEGPLEEHRSFLVDVPYQVPGVTNALLVVRERGDRIPGNSYLASVEVVLSP